MLSLVDVSKDPIHGANQTRLSFWRRIHDFFEINKETPAVRTESSIMHRWLTIQKDVNKYCSCYEAIERRNQSGATIQDMISEASEMYTGVDEEKKSFTLMHCWKRLKDEDKWKSKMIELAEQQKQAAKKKQKTNKESTSSNVEANNNDDLEEIVAPGSQERKRPMGQKQAKEARRGGDDACIVALDKMWDKKEVSDWERE
ncbi:glutathione S-transferase T3-like [Miscanthus floridulus]|uniref:glutathione S-transferase T3-like n=1 Tax=Miscanthus floridulus TaxID=154761 RepID=UPI00345978C5